MFRSAKEMVTGLTATLFLAAGCTAEPPAETAADAIVDTAAQTAAAPGMHNGIVKGVVTDSSGKPLTGAFVKLKNADRTPTFMFISQDEGRYTANMLPAGTRLTGRLPRTVPEHMATAENPPGGPGSVTSRTRFFLASASDFEVR